MMNLSMLMRTSEKDKDVKYTQVTSAIYGIASKIWDNSNFVINSEYEKKLLGDKLFGTRFSADYQDDLVDKLYECFNEFMLDRDELSKRFEEALKDKHNLIDLGDAIVVPHSVIINLSKSDFKTTTKPTLGITFNVVLPEDIPEDYDMEAVEEEYAKHQE